MVSSRMPNATAKPISVSVVDGIVARTANVPASTTTQKPTTTHLVQLPAGIAAIVLSLLIASPELALTLPRRYRPALAA
jgi:hypothetical protein